MCSDDGLALSADWFKLGQNSVCMDESCYYLLKKGCLVVCINLITHFRSTPGHEILH